MGFLNPVSKSEPKNIFDSALLRIRGTSYKELVLNKDEPLWVFYQLKVSSVNWTLNFEETNRPIASRSEGLYLAILKYHFWEVWFLVSTLNLLDHAVRMFTLFTFLLKDDLLFNQVSLSLGITKSILLKLRFCTGWGNLFHE